ncbi:hypothetical protein B0O80DRAFT_240654 [Mortierella sp. GBAus27b]|nr:hypothetical protein B0O80DRAFT_240654 [Mortierella sp. GBAus27b]
MVHAFAFFRGVCCVLCHSNKVHGSSCVHEPVSFHPPPCLTYRPSPSNCLGDAGTVNTCLTLWQGTGATTWTCTLAIALNPCGVHFIERADSGITKFLEAFWGGWVPAVQLDEDQLLAFMYYMYGSVRMCE